MQCMICRQGALWTNIEDLDKLEKDGGFFKKLKDKRNPQKIHYFYICGACVEAFREFIKCIKGDS